MARLTMDSTRDPSVLAAKKNKRTGSEPSPQSEVNARSVPQKTSGGTGRWGPSRNDIHPLARRSSQFTDSKDSVPSLYPSGNSPSMDLKDRASFSSSRITSDPTIYEQPRKSSESRRLMASSTWNMSSDSSDQYRSQAKANTKSKAHRKPLFRRISRDDASGTSIDLSRSSLEQDGLGIYTNYSDREGRPIDPFANFAFRRTEAPLHHRSTSGTSQFSGASSTSGSKPGSQYVHPMRQAPRSYTPPLDQSYRTSIMESDDSGNGESAEGEFLSQSSSDNFQSWGPRASSGQRPRLSLQINDDSFTRLPGPSQTNITASRSSFGYSRDNGSALETASPMSRSSLDFVFRSRTRTSMDPVSRAATIQAARQAFDEKEAAKTKKFEKQQLKAEEKQTRRKEKQPYWRASLKDEKRPTPEPELSEKPEKPARPDPSPPIPQSPGQKSGSWKAQSRTTWMHFVTWLRTRIFKLRRKLRQLG